MEKFGYLAVVLFVDDVGNVVFAVGCRGFGFRVALVCLLEGFKRHLKWPCVLGIGANDKDRVFSLVFWDVSGDASRVQMPRTAAQNESSIEGGE